MATKEQTVVERWEELCDRKRSLRNTIAQFREFQAQIVLDEDWPLFTRDIQICSYWARGGNGCYYPYLKVRTSQEIFPVRRRVGLNNFTGEFIYEDGLGKSKHLGKPGHPVHLSAVRQQIASMQWHIYQEQIEILEALLPRLDEQIQQLQEAIAKFSSGDRIPRPYDVVLGGEEGKRLRRDRYGY